MIALEEQVCCCRQLAELARLQHAHVQDGRTEPLLEVLHRREAAVDKFNGLERVIGPARRRWSAYLADLDAANRARAEALIGESRRLLEEIMTADRADVLAMQRQKLNSGRRVSQPPAARQVSRHYAAAAYATRAL